MRILVTGATGLIGAHALAKLGQAGHVVRAFVRDRDKLHSVMAPMGGSPDDLEVAVGDVCDEASVKRALQGCEGLVHCAGVFSPELADAERLRAVNVEGTKVVP